MWEKRNAQEGLKMGFSHSRLLTPPSLRSRLAHCRHSLTPTCPVPCLRILLWSPLKPRHDRSQAVRCFTATHPETGTNEEATMAQKTSLHDLVRLDPRVLSHCHTLPWFLGSCLPTVYPAHGGFSCTMAAVLTQPKAVFSQQVFFFPHF